MKTKATIILSTLLFDIAVASTVEPYGDMSQTNVEVFNEDYSVIKQHIIHGLVSLEGIPLDRETGKPVYAVKEWHPDFPKGSSMASVSGQLVLESITLSWMPPKPAPQSISNGGKNIRPLPSEIKITIAHLRNDGRATAVDLVRTWQYRGLAHIPYTEIPFFWSTDSKPGSYSSDRLWLQKLSKATIQATLVNEVVYSLTVLVELKKAASNGN